MSSSVGPLYPRSRGAARCSAGRVGIVRGRTMLLQEVLRSFSAEGFAHKWPYILFVVLLLFLRSDGSSTSGGEGMTGSDADSREATSADQRPFFERQTANECQFPCSCPNTMPMCRAGVNRKKDGCDCCYICLRQQGDICTQRDSCDEDKGLYCDYKFDKGLKGICRKKQAKNCMVGSTTYRDGEEFKLGCNQLCTCQDGTYSCSTLCPHELQPPSPQHCREPRLVPIPGRYPCCREWVCPHTASINPTDLYPPSHKEDDTSSETNCKREEHEWSPCTKTCGMGVSLRLSNNNPRCEDVQEQRLCFIRPCDFEDKHLHGRQCKSTWKPDNTQKLRHDNCTSKQEYRIKHCSTCKKNRCCAPKLEKTRPVTFECPGGKEFTQLFQWIKKCECHKLRRCPYK